MLTCIFSCSVSRLSLMDIVVYILLSSRCVGIIYLTQENELGSHGLKSALAEGNKTHLL